MRLIARSSLPYQCLPYAIAQRLSRTMQHQVSMLLADCSSLTPGQFVKVNSVASLSNVALERDDRGQASTIGILC